jgi:hypothetical protein
MNHCFGGVCNRLNGSCFGADWNQDPQLQICAYGYWGVRARLPACVCVRVCVCWSRCFHSYRGRCDDNLLSPLAPQDQCQNTCNPR